MSKQVKYPFIKWPKSALIIVIKGNLQNMASFCRNLKGCVIRSCKLRWNIKTLLKNRFIKWNFLLSSLVNFLDFLQRAFTVGRIKDINVTWFKRLLNYEYFLLYKFNLQIYCLQCISRLESTAVNTQSLLKNRHHFRL